MVSAYVVAQREDPFPTAVSRLVREAQSAAAAEQQPVAVTSNLRQLLPRIDTLKEDTVNLDGTHL